MKDLFVRSIFNESRLNISFTAPVSCKQVQYEIFEREVLFRSGDTAGCKGVVSFEVDMVGFKPWSVDTPNLYTLKLTVVCDSGVKEAVTRFGMTRIHIDNRVIYFNNIPLYICGHIRGREAHDHPNLLRCTQREYHQKNIRMAKEYGFNFVRFHSTVPDEEFLNAADEMGFLCQVEIRPYFGRYQKERQSTNFDDDQTLVDEKSWRDMIYRLRNHPCVLVYCMGNEINSPGNNERVKIISHLTKELDDTRLFLDTCSRGEYDRDMVDMDVQHMGYFAPFGRHYDMFDDSIHLSICGSVTDKSMVKHDNKENPAWQLMREVPVKRPLIAHEICHYNVLCNPYSLKEKFDKGGVNAPWWVDELIKMIEAKGHSGQFEKMLRASTHFQYIWLKQCLESVRKSPLLQGFHMLQLADTDRYENANGLLDCFDDVKHITPEKFRPFNSPTVIIADLPRRSLWGGEELLVPIHLSHFSPVGFESGTLTWQLACGDDGVNLSGRMSDFDLTQRCNRRIARLKLNLPEVSKPTRAKFSCRMESEDGKFHTENNWYLWLFSNRPESIVPMSACVRLKDINLARRYPQIKTSQEFSPDKLMIVDRFEEDVFEHLANGGNVLMLYRVKENRDRHRDVEKYYLPSTWERFKGVIWDRGHNCGGFFREHPAMGNFPYGEFIDWQMYHLIEDCDKIMLDDFPVPVEPIIEGVDKAVRDRFDVGRLDLPEFQYEYTMRKFAYLFELRVGAGRLVACGLNFTGLETHQPEVCCMFENIVNYMLGDSFLPAAEIGVDELKTYLEKKGSSRRVKERMMTQYWQFDDTALESKRYWIESEQWLREDEVIDQNSHWAYLLGK